MDDNHLSRKSLERYSRQIILPQVGITKQSLLEQTSVLIVGCGGLGCPAALYLASGGVGKLGLVDHDTVEITNLHRQILHKEMSIGSPKVESAASTLTALNSDVKMSIHNLLLDSKSALEIIACYDIILDCTDNAATRYLLNDACVLLKKPLVSGSALRFDGHLTTYNWKGGPCYRCLYPNPVPATMVTNCADGGVLGPIVGVIGSLQALEAMKIAMGHEPAYSDKMLIFDGESGSFRSIKLRKKQAECKVCGENPTVKELVDYAVFCGAGPSDKDEGVKILPKEKRITPSGYKKLLEEGYDHLLVDVRPDSHMDFGKLPAKRFLNVPFERLEKNFENIAQCCGKGLVFFVCRRGNDSQRSVVAFEEFLGISKMEIEVKDIEGGMHAWSHEIDPSFPIY